MDKVHNRETSKSLSFLDLTISTENNEILLKIYRKSTQSDGEISACSNQPSQIKQRASNNGHDTKM